MGKFSCDLKWNTNKPNAWEVFEDLTDKAAEKMERILNNTEKNINEVVKEIEAINTKI